MFPALLLASLLCVAAASPAAAETVSWRADEVSFMGGRGLLGEGTRTYAVEKDIVVRGGGGTTDKILMLDQTFGIGIRVVPALRTDGFGLFVFWKGNDKGFSWEWFDRVDERVFARRQGAGRVAISVAPAAGSEEITAVEFLDDARLRYLDDMAKPPGTHTHELLIRQGSVLRVAPSLAAEKGIAQRR